MFSTRSSLSLLLVLPLALLAGASRANWPEFRGPRGDGHSPAAGFPLVWSETENVQWKIPVHGRGWSSPVVWGNQVWLTTATDDGTRMSVLCVERNTGRVLLDRVLFQNADPEPLGDGKDANTYASPSPVIEDGRVYVHFGTYGTACMDTRTFKVLWQRRDLNCVHSVGPGSSPVLFRNLLILTVDGIDVQYMAALDRRTGKTVWKTDRSADFTFGSPTDPKYFVQQKKSFSTPVITEWQGRPLLLSCGAKAGYGYDPLTGKELWQVAWKGFSNAARPVAAHGLALMNTGYPRAEFFAVRLGGAGNVTETHVAWKLTRNVPQNSSPLVVDDLLYLIAGGGILTCVDVRSGEQVYQERLPGTYTGSPVYAGGLILFVSERGETVLVRPGRRFEKVGENRLAEGAMASPAVSDRRLFLRTRTHLYCIGRREA